MTTSASTTALPLDIEMIKKRIVDTDFQGDEFFDFVNRGMRSAALNGDSEAFKAAIFPALKKRETLLQWAFSDKIELLSEQTFKRIFDIKNDSERATAIALCKEQAEKLHAKTEFNKLLKNYEKNIFQNTQYPFLRKISTDGGDCRFEVNSSKLADYILEQPCFKVQHSPDETARYYFYDEKEGYYRRQSHEQIRASIDDLLHGISDSIETSGICTKAADMITMRLQTRSKAEADENFVCFQNGVFDINEMILRAFSSGYEVYNQIPAFWTNSEQETPAFDTFLTYFSGGDSQIKTMILQLIGMILSNYDCTKLKKSLLIYGKPNSGKSVLLRLLSRILGEENCASMSLQTLEQRFSTAAIFDKRLVFCGDMSPEPVSDMTVFKGLTGGDTLLIEAKGRQPFFERFRGLYMAACNDLPRLGRDSSDRESIYQRLILLQAPEPLPAEKRDRNLDEKLYSERNGIIRKAVLAAAPIIRGEQDLIIPERCRQSLSKYEKINSPVQIFVTEYCEECNRRATSSKIMYAVYRAFCNDNGFKPVGNINFAREVARVLNVNHDDLFKYGNRGVRYYRNIQLNDRAISEYGNII